MTRRHERRGKLLTAELIADFEQVEGCPTLFCQLVAVIGEKSVNNFDSLIPQLFNDRNKIFVRRNKNDCITAPGKSHIQHFHSYLRINAFFLCAKHRRIADRTIRYHMMIFAGTLRAFATFLTRDKAHQCTGNLSEHIPCPMPQPCITVGAWIIRAVYEAPLILNRRFQNAGNFLGDSRRQQKPVSQEGWIKLLHGQFIIPKVYKEHDPDGMVFLLISTNWHVFLQKRGGSTLAPPHSYIANPYPALPGGQRRALIMYSYRLFYHFVNLVCRSHAGGIHDVAA